MINGTQLLLRACIRLRYCCWCVVVRWGHVLTSQWNIPILKLILYPFKLLVRTAC